MYYCSLLPFQLGPYLVILPFWVKQQYHTQSWHQLVLTLLTKGQRERFHFEWVGPSTERKAQINYRMSLVAQSQVGDGRLENSSKTYNGCEQTPSPKASRSPSAVGSPQKQDLRTERLTTICELDSKEPILQQINRLLNRSRKIAMLTGAGISCNAGIPDFRSSTGLYDLVKKQFPDLPLMSGQEMFDISLFRDELKISAFATFMEKLYSSVQMAHPTKTHRFIAHLKDRNKLLRCYTQNIDGLEESLGLEMSNSDTEGTATTGFNSRWKNYDVVQLHGDLKSLACTRCFHVFQWNRYWCRSFRRGELPTCPSCEEQSFKRFQQGKRHSGVVGLLRPNVVLYGENHPACEFIAQGLNLDVQRGRPDFFIIMGTSLRVDGVKRVVRQISKQVHERGGVVLLVNKTSIGDSSWNGVIDYQIKCDCDHWVSYLELQMPDFFKTQKQIDEVRQLKREASDLKKKALEDQKKNGLLASMKTPPATPIKTEPSQDMKVKENFEKVKRRLLTSSKSPAKKQKKL